MKKRRIICGIAAFMVAVLSFSGCQKKENSDSKKIPTLLWYLPGDKQNDTAQVLQSANSIISKKIGANLDLQFMDTGAYQEKLTMAIAANTAFDLCFTSDWAGVFLPNVKKGGYMDITDLISKEAPKLKSELPDYLYNAATVDGKIYAVPNLQVLFYQTDMIIYEKYIDKYKFDVNSFKKVEDLEPLLKNIKENEQGIYPIRPNYGTAIFTFPKYEEIGGTGVGIEKNNTEGKAVILSQTPEFKHGIKVLREWYEKGYIRSDVNSVMDDQADLIAGKYGMYQGVWKPGTEAEEKLKLNAQMVHIHLEKPYLKANAGMSTMTAVGRNCKNPQKAVKFLELINTDKELYNLLSLGLENKHYKKISEDRVEVIKDSGYFPNSAWKFGNQFNAFFIGNQADTVWTETQRINNEADKSPISGFVLNTDPIKNEMSQLATVVKEYKVFENGSEDPDKIYNKYIEKVKIAGQEKILAEIQKQVAEFLK